MPFEGSSLIIVIMDKRFKKIFASLARVAVFTAIGYFLFISVFIYFKQDDMIFLKPHISQDQLNAIRAKYKDNDKVEELNLKTPDGTVLHGWLAKEDMRVEETGKESGAGASAPAPLIVYFGGNYEDISLNIEDKSMYPGHSLALVNYRGYGLSGGKPSEKNLYKDALFIYDYFAGRAEVDPSRIVVMGSSLGGAVATYVASKRPVSGAVLITPFDSALSVARDLYPFLPVKLLLRHHFDAASLAKVVTTPMVMIASPDDDIIPFKHAQALFDAWGADLESGVDGEVSKKLVKIPGYGHNTIAQSDAYWLGIVNFLIQLEAGHNI